MSMMERWKKDKPKFEVVDTSKPKKPKAKPKKKAN